MSSKNGKEIVEKCREFMSELFVVREMQQKRMKMKTSFADINIKSAAFYLHSDVYRVCVSTVFVVRINVCSSK